jgi:hypothetical protein
VPEVPLIGAVEFPDMFPFTVKTAPAEQFIP